MTFQGLYHIRAGTQRDYNLIMATWLRGLYYGDSWFSLIPKDIFMQNYKTFIDAILSNPNVIVKVACLTDDPDIILGYSVCREDIETIHYCYVKSAWRKKGIGKSLVPNNPKYVSHLTKLGKSLLVKFDSVPSFNPFSL